VAQYERFGIAEFLRQYLQQLAESGYKKAALEVEAETKTENLVLKNFILGLANKLRPQGLLRADRER
jgi:hypothetical protein